MPEQLLSSETSPLSPSPSSHSSGSSHPSGTLPLLILASTSPRRSQLLKSIGLSFTVIAPDFSEPEPTPQDEQNPAQYVERLAYAKAAACDIQQYATSPAAASGVIVLTADTIVWHNGRILNKPVDEAQARQMLQTLRGQTHQVFTGLCLRYGPNASEYLVEHDVTTVKFGDVSDDWIESYVATGEPMDKAGAYAAQGLGAVIIERVEGDFSNVVGLPLGCLGRVLSKIGASVELWWGKVEDRESRMEDRG